VHFVASITIWVSTGEETKKKTVSEKATLRSPKGETRAHIELGTARGSRKSDGKPSSAFCRLWNAFLALWSRVVLVGCGWWLWWFLLLFEVPDGLLLVHEIFGHPV
jgi:fatty acid desaturase